YGDGSGAQPLTLNDKSFSLSHVYPHAAPGPFTVTVTVQDDDGGSGSASAVVKVNHAPVANAGATVAGFEGASVQFDGAASSDLDGDALTYTWTFGDGSSGSGPTPTHVYADNGAYTVT